jgi:PPM family protein phosphatase
MRRFAGRMAWTGQGILTDVQFDISSAQGLGRRDCQEDALVAHFAQGSELGFVVLADGMGGHAAGDIASKIVVTEVFSELLFETSGQLAIPDSIATNLRNAALAANACLEAYVAANPNTKGMGATLVAPAVLGRSLWWISIGDSPLFLFRNGVLQQLNEDHSLAPQIDFMASQGLLDPTQARDHPDRNVLTSVLCGQNITRIDCPTTPFTLEMGDILIVASDGLQFLDNSDIGAVLLDHADKPSAEIVSTLLAHIADLDDPDQDNVSFCVIRVLPRIRPIQDVVATWHRHGSQSTSIKRARR